MDVLDSHLESITFNLISTIRSWIAVIAAALGIFKLRCTGSSLSSSISACGLQNDILETPILELLPLDSTVEAPTTSLPSATVVADIRYGCGIITKGRFTVYYEEDCSVEDNNENSTVNHHKAWLNEGFNKMNYDVVDRVVKMSMGDAMGWYRLQDLTVVSGNVVKLWDGGSRTRSSSTTFKPVMWYEEAS